jgi:hypothetical protein
MDHFQEMVKGNMAKVSEFPSYASMRVSMRTKAYEAFKKSGGAAPEVTPEEFLQFQEIVKANKSAKKGGVDDAAKFFAFYQALRPTERKALYEARGK